MNLISRAAAAFKAGEPEMELLLAQGESNPEVKQAFFGNGRYDFVVLTTVRIYH
jgi:hypothetical protein